MYLVQLLSVKVFVLPCEAPQPKGYLIFLLLLFIIAFFAFASSFDFLFFFFFLDQHCVFLPLAALSHGCIARFSSI